MPCPPPPLRLHRARALRCAAALTLAAAPVAAQTRPDTARSVVVQAPAGGPQHTPRQALTRALLVPGWGQATNGQLYKVPVVVGALAGTAGGAAFVHTRFREADRAFLYRVCIVEANPRCRVDDAAAYRSDYERRYAGFTSATIRSQRDRLHRNRDLLVLGVGVLYALQAADAYVAAHLLDFDDDERLSLRLVPSPAGVTASLRLTLPTP